MKDQTYQYDGIVVGNSLSALLCGYASATPVLMLHPREPLFFETFEPDVDLSFLGFENKPRTINTTTGQKIVGFEKYKVYRKLAMIMSLAGLLPLGNKATMMRLTDEKNLKVILDYARSVNFSFEKITTFGTEILEPNIPPKKYMVLDWMNVRSGMTHSFDRIEGDPDFVNCIHFYPSERIHGNHPKRKDLVSVSYLTRQQLENYEFSDTYARFEIVDKMRKAGIRGARNGRDVNNPEKYKYYAVKVESDRREALRPIENVNFTPAPSHDFAYLQYLTDAL